MKIGARMWIHRIVVLSLLVLVAPIAQAVENTQDHPLFVYQAPTPAVNTPLAHGQSIQGAWFELSEFFQAHGAINLPQQALAQVDRQAWTTAILEQLKDSKVPLIPTICDGPAQRFESIELIESWLKAYSNVEAVHVKQPQFTTATTHGELTPPNNDPLSAWLTGAIQLTKRHQRKLILELDGLNPHILMSHPQYKALYDSILKHQEFVTVLYTQGGQHTILGNTALMGLWLEGAISQWGMSIQPGSYAEAGLRSPGLFGSTGRAPSTPPSLYRAWILNGAMTGATTYWFNNADELWAGTQPRYWAQSIAPTLLDITREGYIARKDLVQRNALVAYRLNPASTSAEFTPTLNDIDGVFHEGRMIHAAYGMEQPGQVPEWIPNIGTHYWIPILSAYAVDDILFAFKEVFLPGSFPTIAAWQERLKPHYAPDGQGSAFIQKVGRAYFIMHTRENAYAAQTYRISGLPAPLHDINATREGSKVTLNWPFREGDVSYTIYRLNKPNLNAIHTEDFVEIATGLDSRSYTDENVSPGETVLYSVTALTNERSQWEGSINYGDYQVISAVKSRIDAFAMLEPYTMRSRPVNGIPRQSTGLPESQPTWIAPTPDNAEALAASEGIARTLHAFSLAFTDEDLIALMPFIHDDYTDEAGTSKALLGSLIQALFMRYQVAPLSHQIQSWEKIAAPEVSVPSTSITPPNGPLSSTTTIESFDLSNTVPTPILAPIAASGACIRVSAYLRILATTDDKAFFPHPIVTFPKANNPLFNITFKQNGQQQWAIQEISPPLLQVGDLLK
jgi:hypothetical protein